jgi:hypothetical protein
LTGTTGLCLVSMVPRDQTDPPCLRVNKQHESRSHQS